MCVQRSMGKGVFQALPLSLSGVSKLLELMDWDGDVADSRASGGISGEDGSDADAFILVQPQNIVGYSILPYIAEMEEAVGDKPMIMINPRLGVAFNPRATRHVRQRSQRAHGGGRGVERCYHFRLLYRKPYFHPIYGALRFAYYENEWELYKRTGLREAEKYELLAAFGATPTWKR